MGRYALGVPIYCVDILVRCRPHRALLPRKCRLGRPICPARVVRVRAKSVCQSRLRLYGAGLAQMPEPRPLDANAHQHTHRGL
jgi:hypothetical protein